jgi:hypothetical protein
MTLNGLLLHELRGIPTQPGVPKNFDTIMRTDNDQLGKST